MTKSGTNQWHGNLFEFVRNDMFNAKDYFTGQKDVLKRNQFGGSLGGAMIKDKLFIFWQLSSGNLRGGGLGQRRYPNSHRGHANGRFFHHMRVGF